MNTSGTGRIRYLPGHAGATGSSPHGPGDPPTNSACSRPPQTLSLALVRALSPQLLRIWNRPVAGWLRGTMMWPVDVWIGRRRRVTGDWCSSRCFCKRCYCCCYCCWWWWQRWWCSVCVLGTRTMRRKTRVGMARRHQHQNHYCC